MPLKKKIAEAKLPMKRNKVDDHPADLNYYEDGGFYHVDINRIIPDANQPRKYFDPDSLAELSQSIEQNGVLQPVIIRMQDDKIYLVAGERRFRAAKMAGLEKIPAIMTTGNPTEIALIENLQRENLNPIEESEALNRMIKEYNYTQEKLAIVIGKAQSTVAEILSLNRLSDNIKDEVKQSGTYSKRVLIEIAKQKSPSMMNKLFNKIKESNFKSDRVREITRNQRPQEDVIIEKILMLNGNLSKLNFNSFDDSKKDQFIKELEKLNQLIENIRNNYSLSARR